MLVNGDTKKELMLQKTDLYAHLYCVCGTSTVEYFEMICRKIHGIEIKIHSFKGGLHDKEE